MQEHGLEWDFLIEHNKKQHYFLSMYKDYRQTILEGNHSPSNWGNAGHNPNKGQSNPTEQKAIALTELEESLNGLANELNNEEESIKAFMDTLPKGSKAYHFTEMAFLLCIPMQEMRRIYPRRYREEVRQEIDRRAGHTIAAKNTRTEKTESHAGGRLDTGKALALHRAGWTSAQIAQETGQSLETIARILS